MGFLVNVRAVRTALPAAACLLALAGCSNGPDPVPAACSDSSATLQAALRRAPGAVRLADGTPLSRCISRARSDSDLQSLGLSLTRVADTLRAQAATDPSAALRLGYFAGAVHAGAAASASGIATQLARHLEHVAMLDPGAPPAAGAALRRGLRAGERSG
ncbi:MAG TPA: hypothetical protein VHZ75_01730 [Solirubrobacteraceae bacterium]|nr:hypothetical protein [Solirubrobacteraceae bacterium]